METLDVCQAAELKLACRKHGVTNEDLKWLIEGDVLAQLRLVRQGRALIKPVSHVIDCDAHPTEPKGWQVSEHRKMGKWEWNSTKVQLWLARGQAESKGMNGTHVFEVMRKKKNLLNANVLDFLLANPHLVPESWKKKKVCFWGTVYRDWNDDLMMVRSLVWDVANGFVERHVSLEYSFDILRPAAVLKR